MEKLAPQVEKWINFKALPEPWEVPQRFTFPFYYEPHPLALKACEELQEYLLNQREWEHDFGQPNSQELGALGKMFGVLVVQDADQQLGYLAAFSGKLADSYQHSHFVPPVYDLYQNAGFYQKGELEVNALNDQVKAIEKDPAYATATTENVLVQQQYSEALNDFKKAMKQAKAARRSRRQAARYELSNSAMAALEQELSQESISWRFRERDLKKEWQEKLRLAQEAVDGFEQRLHQLKEERRQMSNGLQQRIFEQYKFYNQAGETASLQSIFAKTVLETPPAGAGECAAPKLLQYAFIHGLQPVCMAEFWWGQSPKKVVRKHGNFYPACRGKCEPILTHMLAGMELEPNPLLENPAEHTLLEYVYEDDHILLVNKPPKFLSVPGKHINDCVWLRVKWKLPQATGPLIVHRLDMATSGLLLVAKTKEAHKFLQAQFVDRSVKKRYEALLDGVLAEDSGSVQLPLRQDFLERPRQMVDFDHGKPAHTTWEVIERSERHTRVFLYPQTGRTHQLRVHAAHALGLNSPIVGDHLYGQRAERLHLHAGYLEFVHPYTQEVMSFSIPAGF